jgi:YfiH family protein
VSAAPGSRTDVPRAARALARFEDADGFVGYRAPTLVELGIPHVFTTRIGAERRTLDLGALDAPARERIARAAGAAATPLVAVTQVHGAAVLVLGANELPPPGAEADGIVSARPDVLVGVHVADCVPVLLARADGRLVAAVHAGWRGLVAGVIPRALERFAARDAGRPESPLVAAIGPCLSRERFEVGPEVTEAFERAELASSISRARAGARARIDLRHAALLQLRAGGVERIDVSDRCTYEHATELWSYRRDVTHGARPRTGRLGAFIAPGPRSAGGLPSFDPDG